MFEWQGKKGKITAINTVSTRRRVIQVRRKDKRQRRQETWWSQCVWEVLAINRFIYASSVQQPNAGLLGSDSEYSSIKSSGDTSTHVQWFCQSHADVQSIPEACHKHTVKMCKSSKRQTREALNELELPFSAVDQKWLPVFKFIHSNNLSDILQECLKTPAQWLQEKASLQLLYIFDSVSRGILCIFQNVQWFLNWVLKTSIQYSNCEHEGMKREYGGWMEKPLALPHCPLLLSHNSPPSDVEITERKRGLWSLMGPCWLCGNDIHGSYLHKHNYGGLFWR